MRNAVVPIAACAIILVAAYAFATGGTPGGDRAAWLKSRVIAHRGRWADGPDHPENSLAAFAEAADNGFAVELDVQRSADGVSVVIHDEDLKRMTGEPGGVAETSLPDLKRRRLRGGDETVPTLAEALSTIDGRVPVLVEIKNEGEVGPLEDDVAGQLAAYDGEAAVMSFNPFSLARVAKTSPQVVRGQLSSAFEGEDLAWYEVFLLRNLLMNWKSRPDFIAYDLAELPSLTTTLQRLRGRPLAAWTAKDEDARAEALRISDAVICDPGALP